MRGMNNDEFNEWWGEWADWPSGIHPCEGYHHPCEGPTLCEDYGCDGFIESTWILAPLFKPLARLIRSDLRNPHNIVDEGDDWHD